MASTELIPELNIRPPWFDIQIASQPYLIAFFISSDVKMPLAIIGSLVSFLCKKLKTSHIVKLFLDQVRLGLSFDLLILHHI